MSLVRNLLAERRRRMLGSLMRYIEQEVNPKLDPRQREALRTKVISSVGEYHDSIIDIVRAAADDNTVGNEEVLIALARLDAKITRGV